MSGSKSSDASFASAPSRSSEESPEHPLGLTVHNLPEAEGAVQAAQRTRYGRLKMLLLLLVCAAPVIASYFTYYVVRPDGRRNYGELITPQRTVPALPTTTLAGAQGTLDAFKGQWVLVSVSGGACEVACQNNLYLQRQLRESVGREKDRVDWAWLINDGVTPPPEIAAALSQATVLRVAPEGLAAWLEPAAGHALQDHIYVIDPMGNWMLRFPALMDKAGAAKAKRDIERLLRASSSWDQAGRPERN